MSEYQPSQANCERCTHIADDHRLDDSTNVSPTDPSAQFRCIWPVLTPGILVYEPRCECPDFLPPPEYVRHFEQLS